MLVRLNFITIYQRRLDLDDADELESEERDPRDDNERRDRLDDEDASPVCFLFLAPSASSS